MHPAKEFFDAWAPFYDADYERVEFEDVDFYRDLAAAADGPVLELGVGTGRVYLDLLRAGVDADGLDVSGPMLDELREKASAEGLEPSVWQADMSDFEVDREYGLVIVPFRAFLHNVTRESQVGTLECARAALAPGGTFACAFFAPRFDVICESYGSENAWTVESDGETYRIVDYVEFEDELEWITHNRRRVERPDDGEVVAEGSFRLKLVSKREFESLLEATGWSDWTVYGGFDREPLESVEQELVWVVER